MYNRYNCLYLQQSECKKISLKRKLSWPEQLQLSHHKNYTYKSQAGKQNAVQVGRKGREKIIKPIISTVVRSFIGYCCYSGDNNLNLLHNRTVLAHRVWQKSISHVIYPSHNKPPMPCVWSFLYTFLYTSWLLLLQVANLIPYLYAKGKAATGIINTNVQDSPIVVQELPK